MEDVFPKYSSRVVLAGETWEKPMSFPENLKNFFFHLICSSKCPLQNGMQAISKFCFLETLEFLRKLVHVRHFSLEKRNHSEYRFSTMLIHVKVLLLALKYHFMLNSWTQAHKNIPNAFFLFSSKKCHTCTRPLKKL